MNSNGRLAQRLERSVYTRKVVRSNRTVPTTSIRSNPETWVRSCEETPPLSLALDELLPAVYVVGGACKGRVHHDVYGERGHVGWADHAGDRQSGAQLLATRV